MIWNIFDIFIGRYIYVYIPNRNCRLAALFAVLISSFDCVISGGSIFINGYEFSAKLIAYLSINNELFTPGIGIYFAPVGGFVAALLFNTNELISCLFRHTLASRMGVFIIHNDNFIGNDNQAPASGATGIDIG